MGHSRALAGSDGPIGESLSPVGGTAETSEEYSTRVLAVVDDTPDVRRMVRALLAGSGIDVVHEASTALEAISLLTGQDEGVVILDQRVDADVDGLPGARLVKAVAPSAKVIVFSAYDLSAEVAADPTADAFVRKDQILDLPRVVRALGAGAAPATALVRPELGDRTSLSPEDLLLARWLSRPALLFGTVPPPLEAADVVHQLLHPTGDRTATVLHFVAASGDIDVAVAHLLGLRQIVEANGDLAVDVDLRLIDLLIVEVTSQVIAAARRAAMVDPLTGIGNRRALELELPPVLARAERTARRATLLYFDLVGLKATNDRDGHEAGDKTITDFARAMDLAKRSSDSCYRVGGDEFVAVLVDSTDLDVDAFADRLGDCGAPAFSMGIASTTGDGFEAARLIRLADVRMLETRYHRRATETVAVDVNVR